MLCAILFYPFIFSGFSDYQYKERKFCISLVCCCSSSFGVSLLAAALEFWVSCLFAPIFCLIFLYGVYVLRKSPSLLPYISKVNGLACETQHLHTAQARNASLLRKRCATNLCQLDIDGSRGSLSFDSNEVFTIEYDVPDEDSTTQRVLRANLPAS